MKGAEIFIAKPGAAAHRGKQPQSKSFLSNQEVSFSNGARQSK
jgi:hypothetical protein